MVVFDVDDVILTKNLDKKLMYVYVYLERCSMYQVPIPHSHNIGAMNKQMINIFWSPHPHMTNAMTCKSSDL